MCIIFIKDRGEMEEKKFRPLTIEIKCKTQQKMDMIIIATNCTKFWV